MLVMGSKPFVSLLLSSINLLDSMNPIKADRISFSSVKHPLEYNDFLEVQLKSFKELFQLGSTPEQRKNEGLFRVFNENFPISDTRNNFSLEFLDYCIDPPRYTIQECLEQGLTYQVPLKATLKLSCNDPDHEDFDTVVQEVYLGMIPYMTEKGSFVVNGAERVVKMLRYIHGDPAAPVAAVARVRQNHPVQGFVD